MFLSLQFRTPEFRSMMANLDSLSPRYAPWRFLKNEYLEEMARDPKPLWQWTTELIDTNGAVVQIRFAAVISRMSRAYAIVDFVDNTNRVIFGTLEVVGEHAEERSKGFAKEVLMNVQESYREEEKAARAKGHSLPSAVTTLPHIKTLITSMIATMDARNSEPGN
jgi:spermidine synthase